MRLLINHALNYFFLIFHSLLILLNVFGWMFKKTRRLNLISVSLTAFSWFILGIFYGFGYCFCTDWHWQVRGALGYKDSSISYIHFLLLEITGINFNEPLVIKVSFTVFFISIAGCILVNTIDLIKWLKKRR